MKPKKRLGMNEPIVRGVGHQRIIQEREALIPDPLLDEKMKLASSFENATVREIPYQTAKEFIPRYEWLGDMGCTDFSVGLYFGEFLAAVECFGRTAGTEVAGSICGREYAHLVRTLCRGAKAHWSPKDSASFLIPRACRLMAEKNVHIFVAYSDAEANEIGTVYQATNWKYCGITKSASSIFVWPKKPVANDAEFGTFKDGKERDERSIQALTLDHSCEANELGPYRVKRTRREVREQMIREGFLFFKTPPKRRYVNFYGNRRIVKELRAALKWPVLPYPKRCAM